MKEIEERERIKNAEVEEIRQDALDVLESAKIEAEGIRTQANLVLSQAEQRSERMIKRANDKVEMLVGPIKKDCETICVEMESSMKKFAEFYHSLMQNENGEE